MIGPVATLLSEWIRGSTATGSLVAHTIVYIFRKFAAYAGVGIELPKRRFQASAALKNH